jgi:hypothetical protein
MATRTTQIFLPLDTINTMFALPTNKSPALLVSMDKDKYQNPIIRLSADLPDSLVSCTFNMITPNNREIRPFYLINPEAWAGAKGFAPQGTQRRIAMTKLVHTDTKVTPYVISEAPINLSAERWQGRAMAAPSCPLPHERLINTGNISTRSIAKTLERLTSCTQAAGEPTTLVKPDVLARMSTIFTALAAKENAAATLHKIELDQTPHLLLDANTQSPLWPSDTPWKPSSVMVLHKL